MVVYDITNRESFENVERWIEEIQSYANERIVLCVVGNKADIKGIVIYLYEGLVNRIKKSQRGRRPESGQEERFKIL